MTMDRDTAEAYVKGQLESYLRGKGINTRSNFRCLNPGHADSTPSMSYDRRRNKCHCFSCGADYSLLDIIGIEYGLSNVKSVYERAYALFGIEIDSGGKGSHNTSAGQTRKPRQGGQASGGAIDWSGVITVDAVDAAEGMEGTEVDYRQEIDQAHANLLKLPEAEPYREYLHSRGITDETIRGYGIGFVKDYNTLLQAKTPLKMSNSPKAGLYHLIFPYPDAAGHVPYFVAEISDRGRIDRYNGKYKKIKAQAGDGDAYIPARIFNERFLVAGAQSPDVVFVCEGIYDALSICQAGACAVALMGVGQRRLLWLCERYKPKATLVIMLDSDAAGDTAAEKLGAELDKMGIPWRREKTDTKDPNEMLVRDGAESFQRYIQGIADAARDAAGTAEAEQVEDLERQRADYRAASAAGQIQGLLDSIMRGGGTCYPTGFKGLDDLLDGGLYSGLYFLGAISSLGKTSLTLQIMDSIAQSGQDVILYSLEMSSHEIMSKSLSRLTMLESLERYDSTQYAKATRQIMTGKKWDAYTVDDIRVIEAAIKRYGVFAEHIHIMQGIGDIGVERIRREAERHIHLTGHKPVIVVDYAQILSPQSDRLSDKQAVDKNVLELKRLSRDLDIPVVAISSFNRAAYLMPVSLSDFKESGAIEYGSDVLVALQYDGMDYAPADKDDKIRNRRIRELIKDMEAKGRSGQAQKIQVKILKNRNGVKGECLLDFYPKFNLFRDADPDTDTWEESGEWETVEPEKPRKSKRQAEKDTLLQAFKEVAESGTVTLATLADALDTTSGKVKNRIKEYGVLALDPKTGIVTEAGKGDADGD